MKKYIINILLVFISISSVSFAKDVSVNLSKVKWDISPNIGIKYFTSDITMLLNKKLKIQLRYGENDNLQIILLNAYKKILFICDNNTRNFIYLDTKDNKYYLIKDIFIKFDIFSKDKNNLKFNFKLATKLEKNNFRLNFNELGFNEEDNQSKIKYLSDDSYYLKTEKSGLKIKIIDSLLSKLEIKKLYKAKTIITINNNYYIKPFDNFFYQINFPDVIIQNKKKFDAKTIKRIIFNYFIQNESNSITKQQLLEDRLKFHPEDKNNRINLAKLYLNKDMHEKTLKVVNDGLLLNDESYTLWFLKGTASLALAKIGDSIKALKEAIKINSDLYLGQYILANAYIFLEDKQSVLLAKNILNKLKDKKLSPKDKKNVENDLLIVQKMLNDLISQ